MKSYRDKKGMVLATALLIAVILSIMSPGSVLANAISVENALTGNPPSEWDITGAGDPDLQGFATDISVDKGNTVHFKIDANVGSYRIDIYRIGYYQGNGARLITSVTPSVTPPQVQPACIEDTATKLTDCGNWAESASWDVPSNAVSGVYIAKLVRTDGTDGASHIIFIVRDDGSTSDILFKTSDTTWQAYNSYGIGFIEAPDYRDPYLYTTDKATKVSYNRPFLTRESNTGLGDYNWFFQAEYPMIRWLEANGYDVSYFTSVDTDRYGSEILNHKVFLSVGHDEYWSKQERENVEAARDAGVNLAFFSGNEIYRKIRWEDSIDGTATPYRTLVCYDESNASQPVDPMNVDGIWTGTWRDARFSPPADGGKPENALSGTLFTVSDGPTELGISLEVPQANGRMRFWRNTTPASLATGETATLGDRVVGYEFDEDIDNGHRPAGLILLSSTTTTVQAKLLGDNINRGQDVYLPGTATHVTTLYRAASGALVFSSGSVQWSWGLDAEHDNGPSVTDPDMQQATVNLFADMGNVQPASLQGGLTPATASTDFAPPSSDIISPTSGSSVPADTAVTISGTASDSGGGVVGGVEVSMDNGTTWHPASGHESWNYTWVPTSTGTTTILSRAADDSGNLGASSTAIGITVSDPPSCTGNCTTIWQDVVPGTVDTGPDSSLELGVKFSVDTSGYITGIRFYKSAANTGIHTGSLWDSAGNKLATAAFQNETASGWQQVDFYTPVPVTAGEIYVASYHTTVGHYSIDADYFTTNGVDSPPLHALAEGVSANGVFAYGSGSVFPDQSYNSSNYWVDVVYSPTATPPPALSSIVVTPADPTIWTGASQQFAATGFYTGGSQDITGLASWQSSNTNAATVDSAGLATAANSGSTTISATVSTVTGSTSLTVELAPLMITTTTLPDGTLSIPYSATLAATNGTIPYDWSIAGGALPAGLLLDSGTGAISGTPTATGTFSFTVQAADSANPVQTATKNLTITVSSTILVITSASNPFTTYYGEILRNEGFNEFAMADISTVTSEVLNQYDVVILGEMALDAGQVSMLTDWVTAGGHLIAMRPDKQLAYLLGLNDQNDTMSNAYLLFDTSSGPGAGLVDQTIQYHGTADEYAPSSAATVVLASLFSDATTTTSFPAVTLNNVGSNGGQAAAFTYDLARSVVLTRQGNPAWAGQDRDAAAPVRSNDLFYGNMSGDVQPDWIDLDKVAIPQADEQQRLLANLIIRMNFSKKPLPRFWYLPRNLKAAVIMTGDDHNGDGTAGRFDIYKADSPAGCSVADWECIRSTSYIYPTNSMSDSEAAAYVDEGFEISSHVSTNCQDWTSPANLDSFFASQLSEWSAAYPSLPLPDTVRVHCVPWSDYDTMPQVELNHGIRLDMNYYYYPPSWINDRPGFFTGSGMPMRFTDENGNLIDVYQAATQLTDESGQTYPYTINTLLNRAIGPEGYYGVFTANIHTDEVVVQESVDIVNSALAHGIPVVSARQMLHWLDGRNASTFSSLAWTGSTLSFTVTAGQGATNLTAMVPVPDGQNVISVTVDGSPVTYTPETIKGIQYVTFSAVDGDYQVTYDIDLDPPAVQTFTVTSPSASTDIPVTQFTANDNVGVAGYMITETATQPAAADTHWTETAPTVFSVVSDGTYTLYPWAKDAAGNVSEAYGPVTVIVDTAAPAVTAFAATSPSASRDIAITSFIASDSGSGVVSYMVTTTSTPPAAGAPGWAGTVPATYTVGSDGSFTLYPWVKDAAGNVSALFGSPVTVLVDTTAPAVTAFAAASPSASRDISITSFTAGDTGGSGVVSYMVTTTSAQPASGAAGWAGTPPTVYSVASDGTHTLYPWAKDAAGNVSAEYGSPPTVVVDTVAPTAAITYAPTGPYKSGAAVTITATFSEAMADAPAPQIAISGANTLAPTDMAKTSTTVYTYSYTVSAGTGTASVALSTGTDAAGNPVVGTPTSGGSFMVDDTAPTAAITYAPAGPYKSGAGVTITATFNEAMADAPAPQIAISGVNTLAPTDMTKTSPTVYTYFYTVSSGTGTANVALSTGTDPAGNEVVGTPTSGGSFVVDNTAPGVTISSTALDPTNTSPIPVTVIFSESVSGFTTGGVIVGNGTISGFAGSGTTYTFDITPTAEGLVTIDIAADVAQDAAGNGNTAAVQLTRTYDSIRPSVTISSTAPEPTNSSPIPVTVTFSETVTGFTLGGVVVGNGTPDLITAVSGTVYTFNVTPSGNGAVTVDIAAGVAQDAAGNTNTAAAQLSRTYDTTAPGVTISSTAPDPTNTSPIPVTVTFSESVSGFTTGGVTIGNGTISGFAGSGTTYTFDITPTAEGPVTIDIAADVAQDGANNGNTAAVQLTRTYDSVKPSVTISSAAPEPTNTSPIPVTVTFSEAVTGFALSDVVVGNGTPDLITAVSGTVYTFNVTPSGNGAVTVDVAAGVTQDAAGNTNTAAAQLSRTYDSVKPSVTISSTAANPTNASPIPVTVAFSESVTGFTAGEVSVGNGTISGFTGSGTSYSFDVIPAGNGAVTVDIAAGVAQDAAGNTNTAATQLSRIYDTTAPGVTIGSTITDPTNISPIPVTVTFSEAVSDFASTDVVVGNGAVSGFTGSGTSYSFNVTPSGNGLVTVDVAADAAHDQAGNGNTAATQFSITFDSVQPTVSITSTTNDQTNVSPIPVTVTFSKDVTGFTIDDVAVGGGTASGFSGSGTAYTFNVTPGGNGTVTVDIPADVAQDASGNGNLAAAQFSRTYDTVSPDVTIASTAGDPTNISLIPVTVTFSEAVTGFTAGDVVVGNGTASGFTGGGTAYSFNVTPTANGTVTIDISAGVAQDAAGNNNTAAVQLSRTYDNVQPGVTISSTAGDPTNVSTIPVTVTFTKDVTGFTIGDVVVGNGTASGFSGSGATYTFNVTPAANGAITVNVAADVAQDAAGNSNTAATVLTRTYDTVAPDVTIASSAGDPTSTSPIPVTVTFSEAVTGFTVGDVVVGNGTASGFTGSGSAYSFNVTPAANGAVTVDIAAGVAQDAAGNNNTAAIQISRSYDNIQPGVTISSTASDPTNVEPIPITVTFSEAVTGFTIGDVVVGNGTASGFAGSGTAYSFNVTPVANGAVTVDIASGVAQDAAGNDNTAAIQISRTYDSVQPAVVISSTAADPTNTSPVPVAVTFSKPVADFAAADVSIVNGAMTAGSFSGSGTAYSFMVTPSADGQVGVNIAAGVAHDDAGNGNRASSFSLTYDATAPDTSIAGQPANPTNNPAANFTFAATETGSSFECQIDGGGYSSCTSPQSYTLAAGSHTFNVRATDTAGNVDATPAAYTWVIDTSALVLTISTTAADPTNASPVPVMATFSKPVADFNEADVSIVNGAMTAGSFSGSGTTYTFTVTPSGDGQVGVNISAGAAHDNAGNGSNASSLSVVYDTTAPGIAISAPSASVANSGSGPVTYTVTYSGADTVTLASGNVTLNATDTANGTVTVSGTGTGSRTVTISNLTGYGTLGITIEANTAGDAAGNTASGAGPSTVFTVDNSSGDFNGDGVDITDALKALRIAAKIDTPSATDLAHGDVAPMVDGQRTPDGKIDIGDVVVILRRVANLTNW